MIRRRSLSGCAILAVLAATCALVQLANGDEIRGHVQTSAGDTAAIIVDGDTVPNTSDPATIFFKLPGTDDEVLVANGKVTGVAGDSVTVKIDDAKGKVEKDQLVRITSANPKEKKTLPAPPSNSPSVSAGSTPAAPPPKTATSPGVVDSAAPPRKGRLVLDDHCDNPNQPLQIPGNQHVNGEREMIANPGGTRTQKYLRMPHDFYFQCLVRSTAADNGFHQGIAFRGLSTDNFMHSYYGLYLAPGSVWFRVLQDSKTIHEETRPLPAGVYASPTQRIMLGVEVIGSEFRVFVDEKFVVSFSDRTLGEAGELALLATAGDKPCTVYYDDVKVYDLSPAPPPVPTVSAPKQKRKSKK